MHANSPISTIETINRIAILSIDSPPVNALSQPVRHAILNAVNTLQTNSETDALVIRCLGRTFFPGADIKEFNVPPQSPNLPDVIAAIENSTKPIIAAIHRSALGGGLEIAMACHARVATGDSKLGLPEVNMGVIPGAGGTQRLPRLVGVEKALAMAASGSPINANVALQCGLIDRISDTHTLLDDALQIATQQADSPSTIRRTRKLPLPEADNQVFDSFLSQNKRRLRGQLAPKAVVEIMRAAQGLSFEEATMLERQQFLELRAGEQSKALRHVFYAERAVANIPDLSQNTETQAIKSLGIIGAGTMGAAIAINFLTNEIPVILIEQQQPALDKGINTIRKVLSGNVRSGRTNQQQADRALELLSSALNFSALAEVDFVIEAAYESMEVKKDIFSKLDSTVKPSAIMATNTSYLNIDEIAKVTTRPHNVIGMHFFSPANIIKLVEVVRGHATNPTTAAATITLARKIGKIPVHSGVCYGFIGNRMLQILRKSAEELVLKGISPYTIDKVAEQFGFAMGPFKVRDLAGLDLGWSSDTSSDKEIRDLFCKAGRRGQKSRAGFYDYDEHNTPQESTTALTLIENFRKTQNHQPASFTNEAILTHLLKPMTQEGKKILEEGIALRASDIDVVWINGYGWPRWTGGPMYYAEIHFSEN